MRDQVKGEGESNKEVTEQDIQAHRMEKVRGCCPPKNNSFTVSAVVPTLVTDLNLRPSNHSAVQVGYRCCCLYLCLCGRHLNTNRDRAVCLCVQILAVGVVATGCIVPLFESRNSIRIIHTGRQVHHRPRRRTGRISFAAYNCMLFFPLIMTFWPQSDATGH